jgi:hypothetical protein
LGTAFEMPFYGQQIPRASILGELTRRRHLQGMSESGERLKPIYLRKSQAEVQFDQRQEALGKGASE